MIGLWRGTGLCVCRFVYWLTNDMTGMVNSWRIHLAYRPPEALMLGVPNGRIMARVNLCDCCDKGMMRLEKC